MRTLWNSQCDLFVVMFMLVLRSRFFFFYWCFNSELFWFLNIFGMFC